MKERKTLLEWPDEYIDFLVGLLARGNSLPAALEQLGERYPDLYPYAHSTVTRFFHNEGKSWLQDELRMVREDAETRSYAHRGSRLESLITLAEETFSRIFALPKEEVTKFVSLCQEFRAQMQSVKAEMEPYQTSDETAMGLFERFVELTKLGTTRKVRGAPVLDKKEWDETANN